MIITSDYTDEINRSAAIHFEPQLRILVDTLQKRCRYFNTLEDRSPQKAGSDIEPSWEA